MKKKYLGIICIIYCLIIIYVKITGHLGNYLAPQMQKYILLSIIPLILMAFTFIFNNNIYYHFKLSDIILLIPLLFLLLAGDGRLTMSLANNRNGFNTNMQKNKSISSKNYNNEENSDDNKDIKPDLKDNKEEEKFDFSKVDFDIIDSNYNELTGYLTYSEKAIQKYVGKTIKIRGFTMMKGDFIPNNMFAIGKYSINCCAADAGYIGMFVKYDISKIEENAWYEIEGVLKKGTDNDGYDILYIDVANIHKIDSKNEEQYVYPCYAYDNGTCKDVTKYNLEY